MKRRCTRRTLWKIKEPQRAFASVAGRPQLTERARPGPQLDIAIVGAGTAGLAVSVFLSRAGHRCTVYEKADETELDKPKGAGLGLQPIGLTVLHKLGLLDNVLLHGHRIDKLFSQTTSDRTVLDLEYGDFRKELFGLGIHREALFRALFRASSEEPGVDIRSGCGVTSVEAATPGATQAQVVTEGGSSTSHDLVIVADGRSTIRSKMEPRVPAWESPYPFGCMWAILPDVEGEFTKTGTLYQRISSGKADKMLGFLPTGRTPTQLEQDSESPELVSLFWSLEMSTLDDVRKRGLDAWKDEVFHLEPRAASLLSQIEDFEQLIPAWYSDTVMPSYHVNRVAFLGDCAHATSPQLGQGANLALVDAWILADCVQNTMHYGGDVAEALKEYDKRRKWRLRFYQINSMMLTPVFQSNSRIVGTIRDLTMGFLCKFPPTRLQMLTVMSGAQNNGIPYSLIPEEEFMMGLVD